MDLLAEETFEPVRRPLTEAHTLPPSCYTSREFYQREIDTVFNKCWNIVGREDYVKDPGDYFTPELVGIPLIVIRGRDGEIRAFVNSCRHRGSRLLDADGNCSAIMCPYHSWSYDLAGRLRSANGMAETTGFVAEAHGLVSIRLERWAGFIFVNFDREAASLAAYLGNLGNYVDSYDFPSMVTTKRWDFTLKTNWKNYVENSQEIFHLPTIHRATFGLIQAEWSHIDGAPGNFTILHSRLAQPTSRAVLDGDRGFAPIPNLRGRAAEGAQYILVYPCTIIGADLDLMWFRQMEPAGPDRVHYKVAFCFPPATAARPDFEEIAANYYKRAKIVIAEDNHAAEIQFAGLNQPFARAGRYSVREPLVHTIHNWLLDRMFGKLAQPARSAAE